MLVLELFYVRQAIPQNLGFFDNNPGVGQELLGGALGQLGSITWS